MGSIEVVYVIAYHAPPLWSCDYMIDHMMLICSVIISCSSMWSCDYIFEHIMMIINVMLWSHDMII